MVFKSATYLFCDFFFLLLAIARSMLPPSALRFRQHGPWQCEQSPVCAANASLDRSLAFHLFRVRHVACPVPEIQTQRQHTCESTPHTHPRTRTHTITHTHTHTHTHTLVFRLPILGFAFTSHVQVRCCLKSGCGWQSDQRPHGHPILFSPTGIGLFWLIAGLLIAPSPTHPRRVTGVHDL